jgi:hypothetical protein
MLEPLMKTRKWDISFHPDGKIDITSNVVKTLNMRAGDVINVCREGGEYYIYVSKRREDRIGRHKCVVWCVKKGNYLRAGCVELCRLIMSICHTSESAYLRCGEVVELPGIGTAVTLITLMNDGNKIK